MQDVKQHLDRLGEKVNQLLQKIEYLRKENIMLIEENVKLKQDLEKSKIGSAASQRGRVQQKEDVTAEVSKIPVEQIRSDLEKYIVEVDKCMELINQM